MIMIMIIVIIIIIIMIAVAVCGSDCREIISQRKRGVVRFMCVLRGRRLPIRLMRDDAHLVVVVVVAASR